MDNRKKQALKRCQQELRTGIDVTFILPDLRTDLTDQEYGSVASKNSNLEQVDQLVNILLIKTNRVFDKFCRVLRNHGFNNLANRLTGE